MRAVQVVAAVLADSRGRILITQRPAGKFMAGFWEFPGGKLQDGESPESALKRELREELGIEVQSARPLMRLSHAYPALQVELDVWRVTRYQGEPHSAEGQALAWVEAQKLSTWKLLPADAPIVTALRMPELMLVTPSPGPDHQAFLHALQRALRQGVELVQLRAPELKHRELLDLTRAAVEVCHSRGARLLLNGEPETALAAGADGLHLSNARLARIQARPLPETFLVGASCHDETGLRMADANRLDYVILGPVQATPSHAHAVPLGWYGFRRLAAQTTLPVYAIGGLSAGDLQRAQQAGAQGVAAMRALWGIQEPDSS
ncbi:MAG: Nudix family hydrolase [Gammaproteobacteria bacterium]|nr:Nudix family hydrolase [Gammaproteobacteria bacterium]MDE2345472.1 Nudix family hydrolase [Gammaproteobacteria bacterium]